MLSTHFSTKITPSMPSSRVGYPAARSSIFSPAILGHREQTVVFIRQVFQLDSILTGNRQRFVADNVGSLFSKFFINIGFILLTVHYLNLYFWNRLFFIDMLKAECYREPNLVEKYHFVLRNGSVAIAPLETQPLLNYRRSDQSFK